MTYHANPLILHNFVCNRTSNEVVAYGSRQLLFEHTGDTTEIYAGAIITHSLDWSELVWGKNIFNPRENYTVYWGVSCDDYSDTNFVLTYDETIQAVNFSLETMPPNKGSKIASYATYADKFIGFTTYFETFQGAGDKYPLGFTGGYQNTNYGQIIRDYFDDMGMGWFSTILAYLIPIIFVGLVYYFMREHEISLPSFLYGLPIIAGLYLSFAIGIMVLWMFLFSVLGVVFSFMYHYREPINKALEVVKGGDIISGGRTMMQQERLEGKANRQTLLKAGRIKDAGVITGQSILNRLNEFKRRGGRITTTDTGIMLENGKGSRGLHTWQNGKELTAIETPKYESIYVKRHKPRMR
jgi:hypothetical protein